MRLIPSTSQAQPKLRRTSMAARTISSVRLFSSPHLGVLSVLCGYPSTAARGVGLPGKLALVRKWFDVNLLATRVYAELRRAGKKETSGVSHDVSNDRTPACASGNGRFHGRAEMC